MISFEPIGFIHSPFIKAEGTPIQPKAAGKAKGKIELLPEFTDCLQDLEGFSHIILLYYFHLSEGYSAKVIPYMDNQERGVFATRAPRRPNPIGLSLVRLDKIKNNILLVSGIDVIDGTPLLDIKPYVPEFDREEEFRLGWLEKKVRRLPGTKDDGRFNH